MDIEQLKLILQTIQAAGAGAKQIGIIWFIIYGLKVFGGGLLIGSLIFAAYKVADKILYIFNETEKFVMELRDIVLNESSYGSITKSEKTEIRKAVIRGIDKN